jgi:hypothetical protein
VMVSRSLCIDLFGAAIIHQHEEVVWSIKASQTRPNTG